MKGFNDLPEISDANTYISIAFERAKKKIKNAANKDKAKEKWFKVSELIRVETAGNVLSSRLGEILDSFPRIDELSEFNKELLGCFFSIRDYKRSLARIANAKARIGKIQKEILRKLKKTEKPFESMKLRKEAFGRFASIMRSIDNAFYNLEQYRRSLKDFPLVKEELFSVCIAGFPNVGKSTLMKRLSGANIEINNYSFTTKKLLINFIKYREQLIQLIDTPGNLDRKDKMNLIEKQADIAVKKLANFIVFVYDAKDVRNQEGLLIKTIKIGKPLCVYISKTDLIDDVKAGALKEKIKKIVGKESLVLTNPKDVEDAIISEFNKWLGKEIKKNKERKS